MAKSRERRTVTILFCDVTGSTAMAEHLDPEDVMEIMDGAFDLLIELVYRLVPDPPAPFLLLWLADWPDPNSFLRIGFTLRCATWRHDTYLALVDEAKRAMDQTQRMGLYAQAERILAEQIPILPLSYVGWPTFLKPWVKQFPGTATGAGVLERCHHRTAWIGRKTPPTTLKTAGSETVRGRGSRRRYGAVS